MIYGQGGGTGISADVNEPVFPTGTLCTLAIEPAGYPYGSFVTVAFEQGNPIFRSDFS
jgi:hypothetical protein